MRQLYLSLCIDVAGTAGCNAGKPAGRCFKANRDFVFLFFQVFSGFDIYSVVFWSGFNFGLLSSITDSAKPEEIYLVIAVLPSVNS